MRPTLQLGRFGAVAWIGAGSSCILTVSAEPPESVGLTIVSVVVAAVIVVVVVIVTAPRERSVGLLTITTL